MRRRLFLAASFALLLLCAACEQGGVLGVDPEAAPGRSAPTLEALVGVEVVERWSDTVFSGFAGPANATFLQVEEGTGELVSRGLIRFGFIEDTVFAADTFSAAQRFDSARVVLTLDSTRTHLRSEGTTLQLVEVTQGWDRGSADWDAAVDSVGVVVPWEGGPGGSLGRVLGDTVITEETDSVVIRFDVESDSLLRAWLDTTRVNTGVALLVGDSGRVTLQLPRMHYSVVPEVDPDAPVEVRVLATDGTYIFDRSAPPITPGTLRVGGVEGWRAFIDVALPDSLPVEGGGKEALRDATINKAELYLVSGAAPDPSFAADQSFFITLYELAEDFGELGPKTPVGPRVPGADASVMPDSLEAGSTVVVNVTRLVQNRAAVEPDSILTPLRLVVRALPEATTFGFWEFGSAEAEPEFQPFIRIVFTRPTEFLLP